MPKFEDLTILSIEQIISRILSHCRSDSVSAREVLQAIKSPNTIEAQVMTDEDLRALLIEWRSKSGGDAQAGQRLQASIKTALPPRSSQFMRGMTYSRNPAGICHLIAMIWLRMQFYPPSDSLHPKRRFYEASAAMPKTVTPQWENDWMRAMERQRLLPPNALKPHFRWTCENVFPDERVFCIQPCLWEYFPRAIIKLINDLLKYELNGFIFITSETIHHSMAATIKIRQGYIVFKFFNPNSLDAERIISLPLFQPESWQQKIVDLIEDLKRQSSVFSRIYPNTDCTMVCFPQGPPFPSSLIITNWDEIQPMSSGKRTLCLNSFLRGIGGKKGDYLNYVTHLIDDIPPEYLGILMNDSTTLFLAAQNGHETVVDIILKRVLRLPPHHAQLLLQPCPNGATALYIAAKNGHDGVIDAILNAIFRLPPELAQLLLQPGFNGETALYIAAKNGHDGVVSAILNAILIFGPLKPGYSQYLVQLVQPTPNGTTALVMAILNRYERVVEIILGALPKLPPMLAKSFLQPMQGVSPVDIAQARGCSPSITAKLRSLMEEFKDI